MSDKDKDPKEEAGSRKDRKDRRAFASREDQRKKLGDTARTLFQAVEAGFRKNGKAKGLLIE